jgi:hypothetical protein
LWERRCQHCGKILVNPTKTTRFCNNNQNDCLKADKRARMAAQREMQRAKAVKPNCLTCKHREPLTTVQLRGIPVPVYSTRTLNDLVVAFPELKQQVQPTLKKTARAAGR